MDALNVFVDIMPEANGFIIVNREFSQITPVGMTFGELASMTGGGVQTPGFMGTEDISYLLKSLLMQKVDQKE